MSLPRVQGGASRLGIWYVAVELGLFRPNLNLSLGAVGRCGVHLGPDQCEGRCEAVTRGELE